MKRMLFVLCAVMLCSMFSFGATTFYTATDTSFCDVQQFFLYSPGAGFAKILVGGYDDEATRCALINYPVNGFKTALPFNYYPNALYGLSGANLVVAVSFGSAGGDSYELALRANLTSCGVGAYFGDTTGNYIYAADTCSLTIPSKVQVGGKPISQARQ